MYSFFVACGMTQFILFPLSLLPIRHISAPPLFLTSNVTHFIPSPLNRWHTSVCLERAWILCFHPSSLSDPWFNCCLGSAAKPVLWEFFKLYPTPEAAVRADWRELAQLLNPLGLHEKRAQILIRFSGAWVLPPPARCWFSDIVLEIFLKTSILASVQENFWHML